MYSGPRHFECPGRTAYPPGPSGPALAGLTPSGPPMPGGGDIPLLSAAPPAIPATPPPPRIFGGRLRVET
ncbi:hypothetical protein GCM10010198_19390 [Nocardia seriolae]|nr:hypothetical protein NSERKGN1266_77440 [Nocardia seriolae]BEK99280.1 hypothetical protein NSER024013_71860 [Nocardia seriolae]GEM27601.1 hypothetical protein NS2_58400 [Nocardia seriolae NBRC 15557]